MKNILGRKLVAGSAWVRIGIKGGIWGGIWISIWGGGGVGVAAGQTHKVETPQSVVRAVGVYEWTGDIAKPTASRLIPVTVFMEGSLQDAGVYLARPVPFALETGNVYELEQAGLEKGSLTLVYARHLQMLNTATGDAAWDDGWFGYGSYKGLGAAKKGPALRASKTVPVIEGSKDGDRPHFANKAGANKAGADADAGKADADKGVSGKADGGGDQKAEGSTPAGDPDRPTMKRRDAAGGSNTGSAESTKSDASAPADDPDRPTMKRRDSTADSGSGSSTGSGSTGSGSTGSGGGSESGVPADDADRPTLKRHSAADAKKDGKREDTASVTGVGSLNDDPNRPNLHRGKPTSAMTESDLPQLKGLPKDVDLQQMVAVSDAANREPHDFAKAWEDDAERKAVLVKLEALARAKVAGYGGVASGAAAPKPVGKHTANSKLRHGVGPEIAPVMDLVDEQLKAYTLSYGGAATYVYTAHTAGTGASLVYVTEVAQADPTGQLKPAVESVTDAAHLDRTPRMRLVDAVDAEASNRASLLFELRGQTSRQFGLYRVIGSQAEQIFLTGTTQ